MQCANAQDGSLIGVQEGLIDAGQSKKAGGLPCAHRPMTMTMTSVSPVYSPISGVDDHDLEDALPADVDAAMNAYAHTDASVSPQTL